MAHVQLASLLSSDNMILNESEADIVEVNQAFSSAAALQAQRQAIPNRNRGCEKLWGVSRFSPPIGYKRPRRRRKLPEPTTKTLTAEPNGTEGCTCKRHHGEMMHSIQ
jgi:hypothetical protein